MRIVRFSYDGPIEIEGSPDCAARNREIIRR